MLVGVRQRFAQELAVHADFAGEEIGGLRETLPRVAQSGVDPVAEHVFEFAQRAVFGTAQQDVELSTTGARLAKRGQNAVGGEGALVHAFDVVDRDRRALAPQLPDEIIEQLALADQRIVQRVQQGLGRYAESGSGFLWKECHHRHHRVFEPGGVTEAWGASATMP